MPSTIRHTLLPLRALSLGASRLAGAERSRRTRRMLSGFRAPRAAHERRTCGIPLYRAARATGSRIERWAPGTVEGKWRVRDGTTVGATGENGAAEAEAEAEGEGEVARARAKVRARSVARRGRGRGQDWRAWARERRAKAVAPRAPVLRVQSRRAAPSLPARPSCTTRESFLHHRSCSAERSAELVAAVPGAESALKTSLQAGSAHPYHARDGPQKRQS